MATDFHLDTPKELVIVTRTSREDAGPLLAKLRSTFLPNRVLIVATEGADLAAHLQVVPLLRGKAARKGQATAYVCQKRVCKLPTSDPEVFARQIQNVEPLKAAAGPGGSPLSSSEIACPFDDLNASTRALPSDPSCNDFPPFVRESSPRR